MPLHRTARRRWRRQNSGVGVAGDAFDNGASHYRFRHRRQWRRFFHKHDPKKRRLSLVTSIEGFRAIAARTGNYRPDETEPGFVSDNALKAEPNPAGLVSCSVRVWQYAHGQWFPITGVVRWDEFAPIKAVWVDNQPTDRGPRQVRPLGGHALPHARQMRGSASHPQGLAGRPQQHLRRRRDRASGSHPGPRPGGGGRLDA